jgi:imidazole glycerol-phosphate synthase subunit HisH
MKLGIVDLDTGNLASLLSALNKLNINFKICKNNFDFQDVDKIILPGVGAFKDLMKKIKEKNMDKTILAKIDKNVPILGVCVGFQILFSRSNEHGDCSGLDLIKGNFINFKDENKKIKVPHVGWNECKILNENKLFQDIKDNSDFYFTHSYYLKNYNVENVITETMYDLNFVSSINKKNIYGVQFHPEKSQSNGLKVIKNFYERC